MELFTPLVVEGLGERLHRAEVLDVELPERLAALPLSIDVLVSNESSNASPSSSSTRSGLPQSSGAPAPSGGGGWNGAVIENIFPMPPSGTHVARRQPTAGTRHARELAGGT